MTTLDKNLVNLTKRIVRKDGLSEEARIALNLFWRADVSVYVLAEVFKCSRNTIYANCLTGAAVSYTKNNKAHEINAFIDRIGPEKAWEQYMTPEWAEAVNVANAAMAEKRKPKPTVRKRMRQSYAEWKRDAFEV